MTQETHGNQTWNRNQNADLTLTDAGVTAEPGGPAPAKGDAAGVLAAEDISPCATASSSAPATESSVTRPDDRGLTFTDAIEWVAAARNAERGAVELAAEQFFRDQRTYLQGLLAAIGASAAVIRRAFTDLERDYDRWHRVQFESAYVIDHLGEDPQLRLGL